MSKFKKGDIVKPTVEGSEECAVQLEKLYTVLGIDGDQMDDEIKILDDDGDEYWYSEEYFVLAEPKYKPIDSRKLGTWAL